MLFMMQYSLYGKYCNILQYHGYIRNLHSQKNLFVFIVSI